MSKAPFLPIRDLVIFPNVVTPIYVGRANSIATLEKAIANKTKLVLGLQKTQVKKTQLLMETSMKLEL